MILIVLILGILVAGVVMSMNEKDIKEDPEAMYERWKSANHIKDL